jgi:hypothetical protein
MQPQVDQLQSSQWRITGANIVRKVASHGHDNVVNFHHRDALRLDLAPVGAPVMIRTMNGVDDDRSCERARRRKLSARRVQPAVIVMACIAIAAAGVVSAVDDFAIEIERVEGAGWIAEGIAIRLELPENAAQAHATVRRLKLAARAEELRNVRIDCKKVEISDDTIACQDARIVGNLPSIGAQTLTGRVVYGRRTGELEVELAGLRLGSGSARIKGAMNDNGWQTQLQLDRVAIEPIVKLARDWQLPLPELSATGTVTLSLSARGSQAALRQAQVAAKFVDLTASNSAGSLATEKFSFDLRARIDRIGNDWRFDADLQSNQGQAYAQPVFLDLGAHALALSASGRWRSDGTLNVEKFKIDHRDVAQGEGSATVQFDHEQPLRALALDLKKLQFPGAYESYFQPLLLDTSFKALQSSGGIAGRIVIAAGLPQRIDLHFDSVTVDDAARTLVLHDLQGDWHWRDEKQQAAAAADARISQAPDSSLSWRSGALLNLELGAGALQFNTQGRQFRLLQPARIPVLDGAIELETFRVRNVGEPTVAFLVDATIQPISVRELCKAFGWPEFGGSIGGVISKLRMREHVITLGTTLQAQVFDGDVTIKDLRLEQPFGQWPRFHASIALKDLDLELVTRAFSFGRITGKLSGEIDGLELFNWMPVAFDARLYTPADDHSRHRISQRAVENIGSIGGGGAGVAGALSGGFLRFFDDFTYERLGLSCRLEQDICVMNGVAPAPNGGYYLVKGKGLPRIDVIGGARRVDWPRLVQQLIAVTESEGPVVK